MHFHTSKTWKEKLRTACLDRAREKRRRTPVKKVHEQVQSARLLIEKEMIEQGIVLSSPCTVSPDVDSMEETPRLSSPETPHASDFISEEELFELLSQVEAELEKVDTLQLEEMLEFVHGDQMDLEERIADYQEWEESSKTQQVEAVLCPICSECNLLQSLPSHRLVCPNHMDGSCDFDLPNPNNLSLQDLRERLHLAYEHHASYCLGSLSFRVLNDSSTDDTACHRRENLIAQCSTCGTSIPIA